MVTRTENRLIGIRILVLALLVLVLTGCGEQAPDPLDVYREQMEAFYADVSRIDQAINAIDAESDDAPANLLTQLDELRTVFDSMASIPIPEEFAAMGDLPVEASEYMDKAVAAYHAAYDDTFDEEAEALAEQYYERANVRIRYMLAILHGDSDAFEEELQTPQG